MTNTARYLLTLLITPILFVLSMWVSVFPHEYAHATVACLYGFKLSPFDIYYGHFNWQNVVFVTGIDEHVNYYLIYLLDQPKLVGWVAFAGPFVTLLLYLLSIGLLHWQKVKRHAYLFYFIAWVSLINLSELLSYMILRAFSVHGDMGHIVFGWGISPWWIFLSGVLLGCFGLWHFFRNILPELYMRLNLEAPIIRVFLLILFVWTVFGENGVRMFLTAYGLFATTLAILFFIAMPLLIFICWPTRHWVKDKMIFSRLSTGQLKNRHVG